MEVFAMRNERKQICAALDKESRSGLLEMRKEGLKFYVTIEEGIKHLVNDYKKGIIDLTDKKTHGLKTREAI